MNDIFLQQLNLKRFLLAEPDHIYWQDKNGVIINANLKQAQSSGFANVNQLIGKHIDEVTSKNDAKACMQILTHIISTGNSITLKEIAYYNNEKYIMLSHKVPLKDKDGKIYGMLGMSFDITKENQTKVIDNNYGRLEYFTSHPFLLRQNFSIIQ